MKKNHRLLIIAALLLLIITVLWGWGNNYASQSTIPQHVQLSSWHIGTLPMDTFRKQLKVKMEQLGQTPVEFTFGNSGVEPIKTTLNQLGITYHVNSFLLTLDKMKKGPLWKRVMARFCFPKSWTLQFQWEEKQWREHLSPHWEESTFGHPVQATREITSDDQVHYTPEKTVFRIDRIQLKQLLRAAIPHRWQQKQQKQTITIEVPLQKKEPPVTVASLQAEGIERKIIEFSTRLVRKNNGGVHNIDAVARTIHNMILKPDAIFDYKSVITAAGKKYGFKQAPIIFNGKLVPGIGGGICQVSGTIYNAVLRTGLEIVERHNHSLSVPYLPMGLDATFSEGHINFRFRNTTSKHLMIRAYVKDNQLTVQFFGTMDQQLSYNLETKTLKILPPDVKYVNNPKLPLGQYETIKSGRQGYIVEVYRRKLIDGVEVARERISIDTYSPQPTLIAVNREKIKQEPEKKA